MEENKLNTFNIYSIVDVLYAKLNELGINKPCELSFTVSKEELKKIDEDLFYRMNKNNDNGEFIPSDNIINIKYGNININIKTEDKYNG